MNDALFPYYERELVFLRQMTQEFARMYPTVAPRLLLEANRSSDVHVERLIQTFAFVAGRTQQRLNDEFPELTDALLQVLYPHYLAPVPSLATLEFEVDPLRAQLPQGFEIKRGSSLTTPPVDGTPCKYRTTSPVTLWPIRVAAASFQGRPFPQDVAAPTQAVAMLRLRFETVGQLKLHQLEIDTLRLHLFAEGGWTSLLYEFLFNHVVQVGFRPLTTTEGKPYALSPRESIRQAGFEREDELLPYPPRAPLGYRLLTEYFTYPAKFLYFDLAGWKRAAKAGYASGAEVTLFLDRTHKLLEQGIERTCFRLGCVPVVNLYTTVVDNIETSALKTEYRIVPDPAFPKAHEVYSVDSVANRDPATNETTTFPPFYSVDHDLSPDAPTVHWYLTRSASLDENDRGTDVELRFVDLAFAPRTPQRPYLTVTTTCTNRDLPSRLADAGLSFQMEIAVPTKRIGVLRPPTVSLHPGQRRHWAWRLVSHLNLNHLPLRSGPEGLESLRDLFRLYDYSDPDAGQAQLSNVALQTAEGIVGVSSRRVIGQMEEGGTALFCRGVETTLELDEEKFAGAGAFLFASIFERFLGLFVSANAFTELVARSRQRGLVRRWPPRPGQLPTL